MDTLLLKRVQVNGERRDQGLALTRAHFRDFTAVQHHTANHLHVVMALPKCAFCGLAHGCKGLGQQVVECLLIFKAIAENHRLMGQFFIGHRRNDRFKCRNGIHRLFHRFHITVV